MNKKLPAWVILTLIALVAALALGATYNGTKDRIAAQEAEKAVATRQELLPDAADFDQVAPEGEAEVFRGLDAAGNPVGYVSTGTVTGFGGPVEVTVGTDASGTITGVRVGGSNFQETAGLGATSKEPAFYEQFTGKEYPVDLTKNGGEIDAITAATITSSAVVRGVNETIKAMADTAGFKINEPVVLVDELGSNRYATSKQGFGGPVYVEAEVVDGVITDIVIGDDRFNETSGYGAGAKEEKFYSQYIGKGGTELVLNTDIDQVSGATITSKAVNDAVNMILLYVNDPAAFAAQMAAAADVPDVSIPEGAQTYTAEGKGLTGTFDVTISVDENAAVSGIQVGDASTDMDAPFLNNVKDNAVFLAQFLGRTGPVDAAEIDLVSGATISSQGLVEAVNKAWNKSQGIEEAPAPTAAPAAEVAGTEYRGKGQGLSDTFPVMVTLDDSGTIAAIRVKDTDSEYDGPFLALVRTNDAFLSQFIGKSGSVSEDEIDLVTGATVSSKGVVAAVNEVLAKAAAEAPAAEPAATEAPAAETAGTEYRSKGQGLSDTFPVIVTVDENGSVTEIKVKGTDSEYDEPFLAKVKDNEEFLNQFIGKAGSVAEDEIDLVTGATVSSKGVIAAVNDALAQAAAAPAAKPAAAEASAEEAAGTEYRGKGQGLSDTFPVIVTVDENGAVTAIKVKGTDSEYDEPFLAKVKDNEEFLNQFIGKAGSVAEDEIDLVTGATVSSKGVLDAVNEVLQGLAK